MAANDGKSSMIPNADGGRRLPQSDSTVEEGSSLLGNSVGQEPVPVLGASSSSLLFDSEDDDDECKPHHRSSSSSSSDDTAMLVQGHSMKRQEAAACRRQEEQEKKDTIIDQKKNDNMPQESKKKKKRSYLETSEAKITRNKTMKKQPIISKLYSSSPCPERLVKAAFDCAAAQILTFVDLSDLLQLTQFCEDGDEDDTVVAASLRIAVDEEWVRREAAMPLWQKRRRDDDDDDTTPQKQMMEFARIRKFAMDCQDCFDWENYIERCIEDKRRTQQYFAASIECDNDEEESYHSDSELAVEVVDSFVHAVSLEAEYFVSIQVEKEPVFEGFLPTRDSPPNLASRTNNHEECIRGAFHLDLQHMDPTLSCKLHTVLPRDYSTNDTDDDDDPSLLLQHYPIRLCVIECCQNDQRVVVCAGGFSSQQQRATSRTTRAMLEARVFENDNHHLSVRSFFMFADDDDEHPAAKLSCLSTLFVHHSD